MNSRSHKDRYCQEDTPEWLVPMVYLNVNQRIYVANTPFSFILQPLAT